MWSWNLLIDIAYSRRISRSWIRVWKITITICTEPRKRSIICSRIESISVLSADSSHPSDSITDDIRPISCSTRKINDIWETVRSILSSKCNWCLSFFSELRHSVKNTLIYAYEKSFIVTIPRSNISVCASSWKKYQIRSREYLCDSYSRTSLIHGTRCDSGICKCYFYRSCVDSPLVSCASKDIRSIKRIYNSVGFWRSTSICIIFSWCISTIRFSDSKFYSSE